MTAKALSNISKWGKDPRYFQIFYLGTFLMYGLSQLGWDVEVHTFIATLTTSVAVQLVLSYFTTKNYSSIKSALITGLGLCLLLKSGAIWVSVLASAIAIASKFIIRYRGKHVFNPANIGIIAAILITNQAWVSPGQWGSSVLFWFFVGAAGLMMILKVGRIDTSVAFLLSFGGLLFIRNVIYLGWEPTVWVHQMSNGTLLLFAFFMITDPMTTPNDSKARIIWATLIGIGLFILSSFFYIQTSAIWVLFFISPFTLLFDKIFRGVKYEWKRSVNLKATIN